MIATSLNIAWSLAEMEASKAGFSIIQPGHFWIGVCKGADLNWGDFLKDAKEDVRIQERQIREDFNSVDSILKNLGASPADLRRSLRKVLGKKGAPTSRPISRTSVLKAAFKEGASLAKMFPGELTRPIHVLRFLADTADDELDKALSGLRIDAKEFRNAAGRKLLSLLMEQGKKLEEVRGKNDGQKKGAEEKPEKQKVKSFLARFGRDLTELARKGKLPPVIGRKEEMLQIARTLLQSRKSNVILVGEAGVGKTGIVEGLAQRILSGKVPDELQGARIIDLSMTMLVAGAHYRGEFEERMQGVIKEASEDPQVILFIDEIHLMMGAGGSVMDAANILKPALARGEIRVIGATTISEYRSHIEKDPAMDRRFLKIDIEEPSTAETLEILKGVRERLQAHHGIIIEDDALQAAINWSVRYLPDFRLPDKAIDLLDTAAAQARFASLSSRQGPESVGREQVARAVANRCKIPYGILMQDEHVRLASMERDLSVRVKGQEEAKQVVSEAIRLAYAGLGNPNRPIGSFLFVGPSGTGKTELAKALNEFLFHEEEGLIRFDMSEFMEEHSVSKLIGAPPGYKGCDEEGQLTRQIRTRPYSVVLFDEIEKAHPRVLDIFLQILDEGSLTDAQGKKCSFRNAVVIMTSNLGATAVTPRKEMGFGAKEESQDGLIPLRDAQIDEAVKKHLRPELVNRLSAVVHFQPLSKKEVHEIVLKCLVNLNNRLADRVITVDIEPAVTEFLIEKGFSSEYGARELERTFERLITKPLADKILSQGVARDATVVAQLVDGDVCFQDLSLSSE